MKEMSTLQSNPFVGSDYIIEQKILAIRDTFGINDRQGNLLAYGKQRIVSWGAQFWFESPANPQERYGEVHGKVLAIRPTFEIYDGQGVLLGTVRKKLLKFLGSEWWLCNASGVEVARIKGNILQHDFSIHASDGTEIAKIHKKWVTIRDAYCIEILPHPKVNILNYLIVAYVIAMDHVEYKKPNRGLLGLVVH